MSFICLGAEGFTCSGIWIIIALLFFISAILRKQLDDMAGLEFSMIGASVSSILSFIIMFLITKSTKWSFVIALILLLVAGFLAGPYLGGEVD